MRQHNKKVFDYIRSVIPKHIPKRVQKEIEEEFDAHISEKVEHYQTLELDEDMSIEKALSDMGDAENIKKSFKELYCESYLRAFLVFIGILVLDFLALMTGFVYFTVDSGEDPSVYHVFLSAVIACTLLLTILIASRKRHRKILMGIAIAMFFISLTFIATSALFQSVVYGVGLTFCYLVEKLFNASLYGNGDFLTGFVVIGAEALNIFFCVFSFIGFFAKRRNKVYKTPPKRKKQLNIKLTAIILAAFTVCLTGVYFFAARYYGISEHSSVTTYITEREIREMKNLYEKIDQTTTFYAADAMLHRNGFITQQEYLETFPPDEQDGIFSEYDLDSKRNDGIITYYNTDLIPEGEVYFNTFKLSKTDAEPITYKSLSMMDNPIISVTGFVKKQKPRTCYERFIRLSKGDKKEKVLKKFDDDICDIFSMRTYYEDKNVIESYQFSSSHDPRSGALLTDLNFYLHFENGLLTEGTLSGMGDDGKYDYDELGDVTVK